MRIRLLIVVFTIMVLGSTSVLAANSVRVESISTCTNSEGVTVGVFIENDVSARHIVIPLEVRSTSEVSMITSIKLGWGGRLPAVRGKALADNVFNHLYPKKDGTCGRSGVAFGTVAFRDTLSHPVSLASTGVLLSRLRFMGAELTPGKDSVSASALLNFGIGAIPGEVVIDTTCIAPNHRLTFVHGTSPVKALVPTFEKGVITIEECAAEE